jgi:hypothetical protein
MVTLSVTSPTWFWVHGGGRPGLNTRSGFQAPETGCFEVTWYEPDGSAGALYSPSVDVVSAVSPLERLMIDAGASDASASRIGDDAGKAFRSVPPLSRWEYHQRHKQDE